ncbi:hypothetical protein SDC9_87684 [bioreactor metagenome]|uniref:Uncharacterized protein n=1 Tax=bioreactor metagenome TaxID=1076179 RepID=A0A644ZJG8_9ZZZZ
MYSVHAMLTLSRAKLQQNMQLTTDIKKLVFSTVHQTHIQKDFMIHLQQLARTTALQLRMLNQLLIFRQVQSSQISGLHLYRAVFSSYLHLSTTIQ